VTAEPVAVDPDPKPQTTAPTPLADVTGIEGLGDLMFGICVDFLAKHRLGDLHPSTIETAAKLGPQWCHICRTYKNALELSGGNYFYDSGLRSALARFVSVEHLSVKHVCEMFGAADKEPAIRIMATDVILANKDKDVEANEEDLGSLSVGWRTYVLHRDVSGFYLESPTVSAGQRSIVRDQDIMALCPQGKGREEQRVLALEHLAAASSDANFNPRTLEVTKARAVHTCGLYAWTTEELFHTNNYFDPRNVTAIVKPYGTIQLGSDFESFRCSDMMLDRLQVHFSHTAVNGADLRVNYYPNKWGGYDLTSYDREIRMSVYRRLCRDLASQFELAVDLLAVPEGMDEGRGKMTPLQLIETFEPVVLPDWMEQGLMLSPQEET
jgi:hypothetical protein